MGEEGRKPRPFPWRVEVMVALLQEACQSHEERTGGCEDS